LRVNLRPVLQATAAACLVVLAAFVGSALHGDDAPPEPLPTRGASTDVLIVIGTGGIGPTDLDPTHTPALWGLLRDGSSAALNVTSVHRTTCPLDGWLTLSAGDRAGQPDDGTRSPPCRPLPDVVGGHVAGWDVLATAAANRPLGSRPGALAQALASRGQCISALGPGAAVGAALPPDGAVARYRAFDVGVLAAGLAGCRTSFVDVGSVRDTGLLGRTDPLGQASSHAEQAAAVDGRIAQVIEAAPTGADVVVVSLADGGDQPALRLVLAAGPRFGPGTLYSPSTHQTGLVQLQDVTATILSLTGVALPDTVTGSALQRSPAPDNSEGLAARRHGDLVDDDLSSRSVRPIVYPFFVSWGLLIIASLAVLALMWWRGLGSPRLRESARTWVRKGLVMSAAVPASTFLANLLPWWRSAWPALALVAVVAVWASVIGPTVAVAGMTFVVLAVDVMNGSRLQLSSLLGLNPIVGGRFFGMGNVAFALFMTAAFLVAIAASSRLVRAGHPPVAALAVGLIGLVAVVVDAAPMWGSDVGGPPALVPGLAILILSIAQVRVTWPRALLIVGGPLPPRPVRPVVAGRRRRGRPHPEAEPEPRDAGRHDGPRLPRARGPRPHRLRPGPTSVEARRALAAAVRRGGDHACRARRTDGQPRHRPARQRHRCRHPPERLLPRGAAPHLGRDRPLGAGCWSGPVSGPGGAWALLRLRSAQVPRWSRDPRRPC